MFGGLVNKFSILRKKLSETVVNYYIGIAYALYSPYVITYPWSSSGFGTKYSDPSTLPGFNSNSVNFGTITS